jgi:xylulokinase
MTTRDRLSADTPGAAYLGLDVGTHALKAVGLVVSSCNNDGQGVGGRGGKSSGDHGTGYAAPVATHTVTITYDVDLDRYAPAVLHDPISGTADADPRVFAAALDAALTRLRDDGFPLADVRAISGAAQQHGSVYAAPPLREHLRRLDPARPLDHPDNLPDTCFSFLRSPLWLDASTRRECARLEEQLGGPARVAEVTGSRAYERFTAAQIAKRSFDDQARFAKTERVLLISSFMASLLSGTLAPEDVADASGMNLADITAEPMRWWDSAVAAAGAEKKLGPSPVPGWTIVGSIAKYFCSKYGIPPEAHVVVWSGDNPNTIAGYGGLDDGDLLVSLGTSDTAQWISSDGRGAPFGHTFRSTLSMEPRYFRMLCFANGSQTREAVRDSRFTSLTAGGDELDDAQPSKREWDAFEIAVASVPPGCFPPRVALCHVVPEILPHAAADSHARVFMVSKATDMPEPSSATWAELCRLAVESRALAIAAFTADLEAATGIQRGRQFRRILLTGGGSASRVFPQILSDVLGLPVLGYTISASAAIGAALRAHHAERVACAGHFVAFEMYKTDDALLDSEENGSSRNRLRLLANPRKEVTAMYQQQHLPAFRALIGREETES